MTNSNRAFFRLIYAFAAAAAVLWLIGLTARHSQLFPDGNSFEDILVYYGRFTLYHSARFYQHNKFSSFAYPAGSAIIYAALFATPDAVNTYLGAASFILLLTLIGTVVFLRRAQRLYLLPALILLSFPLVFLFQRANIEIFLYALIAVGILLYRRGWALTAAVLFGLAAACKFYPILMIGLFLKRKRDLPAAALGIVTFLVALVAATAFAGPTLGIAWDGFSAGVNQFQSHYVQTVRSAEIAYDHCLFSPVKYWSERTHASLSPLLHPYYAIAGGLAALLFLRVRTMPLLNRALFLCTAIIALPPVSYTYTLTHLYLPMLLLLTTTTVADARSFSVRAALAVLFFLMLPFVAVSAFAAIPVGAIQAFAVLLLLFLPALRPWPSAVAVD